jgi:phage shock protein PspC (stress-responsive transcriptional regulator)
MVAARRGCHHAAMANEETSNGGGTAPAAPAPAAPVRRLTRRTDDKVIAGVASGLGVYTGLDKVVFRVAFAVLLVAGGAGALLYVLAWWLIPTETEETSPGERALAHFKNWPWWVGVVLLCLGAAAFAGEANVGSGWVWGTALIGIGIIVFRHDATARPARPEARAIPAARLEEGGAATAETTVAYPVAPARPARERKEHSPLGWITLAGALVATGVATLISRGGGQGIRPVWLIALVLVIIGLGLVVGALFGRARWLILLGLPLIPLVLAASLIHVPIRGGWGERTFQPRDASALDAPYRLIGGIMRLDLTHLDYGVGAESVTASVVAGDLDVIVPTDVTVTVTGRVGAGRLQLLDREDDGIQVEETRVFDAGPDANALDLHLDVSFGQINVSRVPADSGKKPSDAGTKNESRNAGKASR